MSGYWARRSRAVRTWAPAFSTSFWAVWKAVRWTARMALAEYRMDSRQRGRAASRAAFLAAKLARTSSMMASRVVEMSVMRGSFSLSVGQSVSGLIDVLFFGVFTFFL